MDYYYFSIPNGEGLVWPEPGVSTGGTHYPWRILWTNRSYVRAQERMTPFLDMCRDEWPGVHQKQPNFSRIPTLYCAECSRPSYQDFLCSNCRST
jgi:hypothetical protein